MKRRLASLFGAVLIATTLVGFAPTPAHAEPDVTTITGTMDWSTPPPVTGSFCSSFTGPVVMNLMMAEYTGPVTGQANGTLCGVWPVTVTGNLWISAFLSVGVVTVSASCTGAIAGSIPGTVNFLLHCLVTVTTPFGTTSQSLCIKGVATLLTSPGIFAGAGVSPC
jgi:hypothetical protein